MLTNKHNVFLFHFTAHFAAESTTSVRLQCSAEMEVMCGLIFTVQQILRHSKFSFWALNKEYINIKVTK